ncbi:MAG: hypothetical protein AB7U82_27600 [Blastocatellales bacterium]
MNRANRFLFSLVILLSVIVAGFLTETICVTSYNDGGRYYSITVFSTEFKVVDEPAEARARGEFE